MPHDNVLQEISDRLIEIERSLRELNSRTGKVESTLSRLEEQVRIQNGRVRKLEDWRLSEETASNTKNKIISKALDFLNLEVVRWTIAIIGGLILAGALNAR